MRAARLLARGIFQTMRRGIFLPSIFLPLPRHGAKELTRELKVVEVAVPKIAKWPSPPTVESEVPEQAPVVSAPVEATPARAAAPPAPQAPPKIELPSSHATYLNNTPPAYPPLSKRMGEQGRVVIRALISAEGIAGQASVKTSSGYQRLDQTALRTVLQWRYVPGKRAGVPEAMWFNIPLDFVLE